MFWSVSLCLAACRDNWRRDWHAERHFLYVAEPGVPNYVEYGGVGVLVFDMDAGYRSVRRIPTFEVPQGKEPDNVKGIAAHAGNGRLYVSTISGSRLSTWRPTK